MSKLHTYLLFTLTLTITFILIIPYTQATRQNCKNPRPTGPCESLVYQPTCAYYTKNCPLSVCGRTEGNPCSACSDPNVAYYIDGECPPEVKVDSCFKDICTKNTDYFNWNLRTHFNPVCGIKKNCHAKNGSCDKTFNNICNSCGQNTQYPYYHNGPCEDSKYYCGKKRPTSCHSNGNNVCASFLGKDNVRHYATADNACRACKDSSVDFYLSGPCGKPLNNETYCLPKSRPQICTEEYNPVCGFYNSSNGTIEHKIVGNACSACSDKSILYHTPGACVFWCDRNPFVIYDCIGNLVPVCGTYRQNGITKQVSLRNNCLGCYYSAAKIDSYTEGLCPGDDGILCRFDSGGFVDGVIQPVCALKTLNCKNSNCRKSFSDPLNACRNSTYVKYVPGLCPGDLGIPCDAFRNSPYSAQPRYLNVCGYTKNNCKNNSCRKTYDDQFHACANENVKYFTEGPC